jgi:hypothetical protein
VLLSVLFATLAGLRPSHARADGIPDGPTPVAELSTPSLRHHEVLRIDRDFGMDHWEIALDGWLGRDADDHIRQVRLWWVNTADDERRKPFSAYLRRYLEFTVRRIDDRRLAVRMAGDRKQYDFTVEILPNGDPAVFADVESADGSVVTRCRCERGRLLARRVLGIPVGIAELRVRCVGGDAQVHDAVVPHRVLEHGEAYAPE